MTLKGLTMDRGAPAKILYVIDHFRDPYAGAEGQLLQLVSHLDRERFQPHLLVFSNSDYLQSGHFPCDYTVVGHQRLRSPVLWLRLAVLAREFRSQGFQLAHVMFNDASIVCPPVFSLMGIKTIITRLDMGYWYSPALLRVLRFTGKFTRAVLANSKAVAAVTHEKEGIPREKLHVIYNGVVASEGKANCFVAELDLLKQQGAVVVMLVANIRPIKRMEDALRTVASLAPRFPQLHLVIIGGGDDTALRHQSEQAGTADRVHFLGSRSDVPACLAYGDIGLICSESEGFSNSIIEYMQSGMPVICSSVGGNPEAVTHGENGLLYSVGDLTELQQHLATLLTCEELRNTMGARCKRHARERYSVQQLASNHQDFYEQLLQHSG